MNTLRFSRSLLFTTALLMAGTLAACSTAENAAREAGQAAESAGEAIADVGESAYNRASSFFRGNPDYLAVALEDTEAAGTVTGVSRFNYDEENGEVVVQGRVEGLAPGLHGFHVHANGSCDMADGTPAGAAGGHFNPDGAPHGSPVDGENNRHVGDFGNIRANSDGVAMFSFSYERERGDYADLEDLAVLVHGGRDDLTSQPSGAAGARVSCGILSDADEVDDAMLDSMAGDM